jgi:hypothetical protein
MATIKPNELMDGSLNWLDFDLDAGEVRAIIGVDAGSFQQWLARNLLDFKTVKAGKRVFRKFHVSSIPRLVLISEIWKNGVLVGEAIQTADTILAKIAADRKKLKAGGVEYSPLHLIAWFRQANVVCFSRWGDSNITEVFDREGYSSCILIRVASLNKRISEALLMAKRTREAAPQAALAPLPAEQAKIPRAPKKRE